MAKLGEANIGGRMVPAWLMNITAEELDSLKSRWYSNPNLLDNWYFANPVDQRGWYVVPPGTAYYVPGNWDTADGTTTNYVKVDHFFVDDTGTYPIIIVNSADRVCNKGTAVRGYVNTGNTIDRLKIVAPGALLVTDDGINLKLGASTYGYSVFSSIIEGAKKLIGKTVTLSALTTNGLFSNSGVLGSSPSWVTPYAASSYVRPYFNGNLLVVEFIAISDNDPDIIAVKLELGTTQTLAHQENGVWVLNELPNYADTLARCQYYSDLPTTWAPMTFYVADFIVFTVKTHREMRVNLSSANVTLDSSKLEVHSNGAAQSGFTFSVYGGGDDFILVKAAKSGHGLSNAMLIVNNGGIYANANL